ncbi:MAG TPA: serine/threonine-protein kinase [Ktedonobacteraceae bacterium]|nr:serine/threonine-protein kinase [Ktedonobacteraceae bacterium]
MNNRVNQLFGNYRLVRHLGKGGFADVYLGEHSHLGSQAAIKILNTQLVTHELEEFLEEARIIASLRHPSIIRVLDCGIREEDETPFLVMNYAPNGTLRQRHPKGDALPLSLVVSYVNQIASALHYAHTRKLIHRDVKPENMLIGEEQELLLSDFGIALVSASSSSQSTKGAAGTMAYMAPEQIMGKPRMASDQYALGIVVYEWLCGERPFRGGFSELCAQHLYAPPPPLREKTSTISPRLEQIVLKALAKEPLKRYPTIRDFAEALEYYNLHTEEEDERYQSLPEITQVRAMQILPVFRDVQDEDHRTIAHLDSSKIPVELALALDAAPYLQVRVSNSFTADSQEPEEPQVLTPPAMKPEEPQVLIPPVMERTLQAPPPSTGRNGGALPFAMVQQVRGNYAIAPVLPQLPEQFTRHHKAQALRRERKYFLIRLLLVSLIVGGLLALVPLLYSSFHNNPGEVAHAQIPTATSTLKSTPVQGNTPGFTKKSSPTAISPNQLQSTPHVVVPPVYGSTVTSTPRSAPTQRPTLAPTVGITPTVVSTVTPTPVVTVTPTPIMQPEILSTPSRIVNTMSSYCGGESHGGVAYVDACTIILSNGGNSALTLDWTGKVSDSHYTLSPSSGFIAPGQAESVTLIIGIECPLTLTVTFTGPANTLVVPVLCTQIDVVPGAHDFSNSNCTLDAIGSWTCIVTVTADKSNVAVTNWSATTTTAGPTFDPASGTLSPGASVQVHITISASSCPGTNTFIFSVPGSTIDADNNYLPWSC